jgi:hypothetical protein
LTDNITRRVHLLNVEGQSRNIIIHVSSTNSAIRPLFGLQNTLEMTFISGYGIACAYPRLTMSFKGLWNITGEEDTPSEPGYVMMLQRSAALLRSSVTVCTARTIDEWPKFWGHVCGEDGSCPLTIRHTFDKFLYFSPFPTHVERIKGIVSPVSVQNTTRFFFSADTDNKGQYINPGERLPRRKIYSKERLIWGLKSQCTDRSLPVGGYTFA